MDYSKKKIGVISLGCDKNRVDSEKLLGVLKERTEITDDLSQANIVIINTCAFLESARKEGIDNIFDVNGYRGKNLEKIIVTGCLPQKFVNEMFDEFTEVDAFMGVSSYDKIFDVLDRVYEGERVNAVEKAVTESYSKRVSTTPKSYAYLKIADGCDNFCTYCLIPKIRGRYRSTPQERLIEEARNLGEVGELVLVAQDITRYGEDLYKRQALPELIRSLSGLDNVKAIRLLYAYPDKLSDEIIAEIKNNGKVVKYIDIPLQHASDDVLKRMNRKGSYKEYTALIKKLKKEIKGIAIRSTFIAGFPGETEEDFKTLKKFIRRAKLRNAGFFAYSREEDTPAYGMANQIPEEVKLSRQAELYETQRKVSEKYNKKSVGKTLTVLIDGYDDTVLAYTGRAYFSAPDIDGKVYVRSGRMLKTGERVQVDITDCDEYDLYGAIKQ